MEGFSYCGIHSSKLGCWFIPNADDRWFSSPEFEMNESEVNGRDGGYFYGNRAKIRSFSQKCYYEDITEQTRERIRMWLDRKTSGEQVFDSKPFVHYDVRPSKIVPGKKYVHRNLEDAVDTYSGTFTVTFDAFEPYGILNYKYYSGFDEHGAKRYCGMLEEGEMPAEPTAAAEEFLLYNPGTEVCDTIIQIGGTADNGVTIENMSNGTKCVLSSLPESGYLEIHSETGAIYVVDNETKQVDFSYHDEGFMRLDPSLWNQDDQIIEQTEGSKNVTLMKAPDVSLIGRYLWVEDKWNKVESGTGLSLMLQEAVTTSTICETKVVSMNEIKIVGDGVTLNKLVVDYIPKIV